MSAVRYLPPDLWRRMRHVLPLDLPPELRRLIAELVEDGYSWGYVDGCDRGADAGFASVPLLDHQHHRVGTAEARVDGRAPHPSAAHRANGAAAPVTPLRIGQIGADIERDVLGTDQLVPDRSEKGSR